MQSALHPLMVMSISRPTNDAQGVSLVQI